jgi:hypothetical protein
MNFPEWAKYRPVPWEFVGWIGPGPNMKRLAQASLRSDHGELRENDEYPEGIACWYKES